MFPALVLDREQLHAAVREISKRGAFAFDVETVGELRGQPAHNEVTWLALATYGFACAIPFGHRNGDTLLAPSVRRKDRQTGKFVTHAPVYDAPPPQLERDEVFDALRPLLSSDRLKVGHNLGFDLASVAKYHGALPAGPYFDTITGVWLLNENLKTKDLKTLVKARYGAHYDKENIGKRVEDHPISRVGRYVYLDARFDWLMHAPMYRQLREGGFEEILALEMQVLPVVASMRLHGAHVDRDALRDLNTRLTVELSSAKHALYQEVGYQFNVNSTPQKQKMLYGPRADGGQGLKPLLLTPAGKLKARAGRPVLSTDYSTSAEALEPYADHPVVQALEHYQDVEKLESTYVRAYLGDEEKPGALIGDRIYTDFVQYGTVSGRFSSRKPNLQNVPRPDNPLSKQVRGLFTAPAGCKLVVADYGQIELRVLAHYLGTGALFDGFHQGVDAHTATAALIFGVAWEDVTKEMRQVAKAINFAIVFGAGAAKVGAMAKISLKEANKFLALHERMFPEIYAFREAVIQTCRRRTPPYIKTLLGRMRRLPEIRYRNDELRSRAERQAVNSLIQGSAGDLIKLAMVRLHPTLPQDCHLVLTVHDELVVEAPESDAELCAQLMREAMLGDGIQKLLTVPLTSDVVICDSWADAK